MVLVYLCVLLWCLPLCLIWYLEFRWFGCIDSGVVFGFWGGALWGSCELSGFLCMNLGFAYYLVAMLVA